MTDRLLLAQIDVSIRALEKTMARAGMTVDKASNKMEKRWNANAKRIEQRSEQMSSNVRNAIAGIALGLAGREVVSYGDAWADMSNKVAAAGEVAGMQGRSLEALQKSAAEARQELDPYVDLYARLLRSSKGIADSEEQVARATMIASKAFKAGGASAQEQAAGILQLGQALGSGFLQGDELRSIRENAPLVAKAIADAMGVSIGELKKLGAEGKLTSDIVFDALLKGADDIEAAFAVTIPRGTDATRLAFDRLKLKVGEYLVESNAVGAASEAMGDAINFVANNVEAFADAIVIAGAALGGYLGAAAVAVVVKGLSDVAVGATGAAKAMAVLDKVTKLFGGPWVLAITAAAAGLAYLAVQGSRVEGPMETVERVISEANDALDATSRYVDRNAFGDMAENARLSIPALQDMADVLNDVSTALKDVVVGQFAKDATDLALKIESAREALARLAKDREGFVTEEAAFSDIDPIEVDTSDFDQAIGVIRSQLSGLENRQAQIGISVFGEGRAKDFTNALLSGDIAGASALLKGRLEEITPSATATVQTSTKAGSNKETLAAIEAINSAWRAAFETERQEIERNYQERISSINGLKIAEAEKDALIQKAKDIRLQGLQEITDAENAQIDAAGEALAKKIEDEEKLLAVIQASREAALGLTSSALAREETERKEQIAREITDARRKADALAAIDEEFAARRKEIDDRVLGRGDGDDIEAQIERLRMAEEAKLVELEDWYSQNLDRFAEYEARKAEIAKQAEESIQKVRQDSIRGQLQAYGGLFQNVADGLKGLLGEQSTAYKAALAASKAFAIADSLIQIAQATSQVMADPSKVTLEQKLAAGGVIAAQGAALISSITGAREKGGPVRAGGTYLVGEKGPELVQMGGSGQVTSHDNLMKAIGQVGGGRKGGQMQAPDQIVNVFNNAPNTTAREERDPDGTINVIIDAVAAEIERGGSSVSNALEGRYGLNRGAGA